MKGRPNAVRCPKCLCPQKVPADGQCAACGWTAPIMRWVEEARIHPIQPEEREGQSCPECGAEVVVLIPYRRPVLDPFTTWAVLCGFLAGMALLIEADWRGVAGAMIPPALLLPLHVVWRRARGPAALRKFVVLCGSCGFLRIGRDESAETRRAYRRAQTFFQSLYRRLLPVFGFFLVITIGAGITGTTTGWTTTAILVVSGFLLLSVRWYRGVFGIRGWW